MKNFENSLQESALEVLHRSVITGKGRNVFQKVGKYFIFYFSILHTGLFKSYDFIYCHNVSHTIFPLILLNLFRKKKILLNAHGEDILPTTTFGRFLAFFSKFIVKDATLLVVPSHYFKEVVARKFGLQADRIFVSPSGGVDLEVFRPLSTQGNSKDFVIGFASRIEINKGYLLFLQAIKEIHEHFKDVNLSVIMVGGGSQQVQLFQFVEQNHLQQVVHILGPQAQKDLPGLLNKMDVFVFPTLFHESLGLIGLEAMACGIPVIGSRRGGLTDYIIPGKNGLFFEPGQVTDLVQQILYFYKLPAEVKAQMKEHALETAALFGKNRIAAQLINRLSLI